MTTTERSESTRSRVAASESTGPRRFRADIQGLRAIAVVLVILAHTVGWPTGGYIGVDVFFVISGFVITSLILREIKQTGTLSLANFYRRRARRILPAASIVTMFTVLAALLLLPADRSRSVWFDALASTFFAANWRMAALDTDYFQEGLPPSPFQHYWSLSVEEQFYFVWPAVMLLVLSVAGRLIGKRAVSVLGAPAALLVLLSFVFCLLQTATNPNFAYFSSLVRFWELGMGVCVALLASRLRVIARPLRIALTTAGLLTIAITALVLTPDDPFPGAIALLPTLGSAAIIVAGIGAPERYDKDIALLTNRVARYVGDRSYSLYLWHFPLVVLAPALLPSRKLTTIGIIVVTFVLSELSYRFIEDPIRRSNWLDSGSRSAPKRGTRRATAIVTMLGTVLLTAGIAVLPASEDAASAAPATATTRDGCFGAAALTAPQGSCPTVHEVQPSLAKLAEDTGGAFSSDCYRTQNAAPVSCTFGSDSTDATRIALIGDSHAGMYIGILREIAPQLNWSVTTYVGWGCAWGPHDGEPCDKQTDLAERAFTGAQSYDVIVTAASRAATSSWTEGTYTQAAQMWQRAADAGAHIIAMESAPIPSEDALQCIQRVTYDPASDFCETSAKSAYAFTDAMVKLAGGTHGNVSVVKTRDLICPGDDCPAVTGGVIVSRDTAGHLTGTYLGTLTSAIQNRLVAALD